MNIKLNKSFVFGLSLYLMVVGNGAFVIKKFDFKIEYIGLILLIFTELLCLDFKNLRLSKIFKFLLTFIFLVIGPLTLLNDLSTKISMVITSICITFLSFYSGNILYKTSNLLLAYKSLLLGCLTNIIIGFFSGTLGLKIGFDYSSFGMVFLSGFLIKNYCGGIWLVSFIIYYIYCSSMNTLNKKSNLLIFFLNTILIIISGSSGALILLFVFLFLTNLKKFISIQKKQRFITCSILITCSVIGFIFIYNFILPKVPTYAYRIRGLNSIIEIFKLDSYKMAFGLSDIAYESSSLDYTINMRNYLGWDSSVEMAYSNILIKYGIFGILGFLIIFYRFFSSVKFLDSNKKYMLLSILFVTLLSGFVETYFVSIHYVVGPVLYCLINGLIKSKSSIIGEK